MPVYYVETSALVKRYKSESGSDVLTELFEEKRGDEVLVTSRLSLLEVHIVAARLMRGRVIRQRQYQRMLSTFVDDLARLEILVMSVDDFLISECLELLPRHPLRAADALHVASARRVSRAVGQRQFYMVSADREVGAACADYRMRLLNPELGPSLHQLRAMR